MTMYLTVFRPLHIAVAKGTAAAVESIISVMLSFGVSLDYCNNRQQVSYWTSNLHSNNNMNHKHNVISCFAVCCLHVFDILILIAV